MPRDDIRRDINKSLSWELGGGRIGQLGTVAAAAGGAMLGRVAGRHAMRKRMQALGMGADDQMRIIAKYNKKTRYAPHATALLVAPGAKPLQDVLGLDSPGRRARRDRR